MPFLGLTNAQWAGVLSFVGLGGLVVLATRDTTPATPAPKPPPAGGTPPIPSTPSHPQGDKARDATDADLDLIDSQLAFLGVTVVNARELTANRRKGKRVHLLPPDRFRSNLLEVAVLAQRVSDAWGGPLVVSSAYRPQDNPGSRHHSAKAIDFDLPSGTRTAANRDKLYMAIAELYLASEKNGRQGFGGMGFYTQPKGRLHIDSRSSPAFYTKEIVAPFFARVRAAAASATV